MTCFVRSLRAHAICLLDLRDSRGFKAWAGEACAFPWFALLARFATNYVTCMLGIALVCSESFIYLVDLRGSLIRLFSIFYSMIFSKKTGISRLRSFAWLAYFFWFAWWLAKLARTLDFEQLLSFCCKTTFLFIFMWSFLSLFIWKKQRFPVKDLEVEHDFLKIRVPSVILKFDCQASNFTRFLNP